MPQNLQNMLIYGSLTYDARCYKTSGSEGPTGNSKPSEVRIRPTDRLAEQSVSVPGPGHRPRIFLATVVTFLQIRHIWKSIDSFVALLMKGPVEVQCAS